MSLENFNWKKIIGCILCLCVLAGIIIYGKYHDSNEDVELVDEVQTDIEESRAMFEEIIYPAMISDGVRTVVSVEDEKVKSELGYAISGINSLIIYTRDDKESDSCLFELWNNMEQYYMRVMLDGVEHVYKIDMSEDSRSELTNYIYNCYITVSSYLGVANKNRIVAFEELEDGRYHAWSFIEDGKYELFFTLDDGVLTNINMVEKFYENTSVDIGFSRFSVNEQSDYEKTEEVCDIEYVREVFNDIMS